jgi:DNA-binding NarL/FixJ family response regulator
VAAFAAQEEREGGLKALTPRENEVANHVAMGESNREIAAALFLSEETVESHLVRAYSKLGVHSRSSLTAIVVREERAPELSDQQDLSDSGVGRR